jgi:hypothetical protein
LAIIEGDIIRSSRRRGEQLAPRDEAAGCLEVDHQFNLGALLD